MNKETKTTGLPEIVTVPNPILLQKSSRVAQINGDTEILVERMSRILLVSETAVGIAAPQIGVLSQVFLIRPDLTLPKAIEVFINPKIVWFSSKKMSRSIKEAKEGCLSLPDVTRYIERPAGVRVVYQALNGVTKEERFNGWAARIIQHETDHLNGILITGR